MVAFVKDKNLSLVLKPPKRRGVDDAIAIATEGVTGDAGWLGVQAPAAAARMGCKDCPRTTGFDRHGFPHRRPRFDLQEPTHLTSKR
jgi:hypothetical protein